MDRLLIVVMVDKCLDKGMSCLIADWMDKFFYGLMDE